MRWNQIWATYRLRRHEYEAILARQGGVCAICGGTPDGTRDACVDHDHGCDHPGKGQVSCASCVRGILCNRCNVFLSALEDVEWLKKAVDYIGREDVAEIIRQSRLW